MQHTTAIVIGAGQAGLAMSHCLSALGIEHAVLERGRIAERWRSSWHSLRLLTPNWMTRLPGYHYRGDNPDGFMAVRELIPWLERYAVAAGAPVFTETPVRRVERRGDRFSVMTDGETWRASAVIIATGYCDQPAVPAIRENLSPRIEQIVPAEYREPPQLPLGGVLVVGASSTGVQLADEICRSGRPVTLAVGRHTRLPRRYRGKDILWWLDRMGVLSQEISTVHDVDVSRNQPSLQLIGTDDRASIDLAILHSRGIRLAGHLTGLDGTHASFADDGIASAAAADVKLAEMRERIDRFISSSGLPASQPEPLIPTWPLTTDLPIAMDLRSAGIRTVVWATGYRRAYPWLHVPVFDEHGEIRHDAGITPVPGLYVLGLNFQRRRNSSFIDGVGADALFIAEHLTGLLNRVRVA